MFCPLEKRPSEYTLLYTCGPEQEKIVILTKDGEFETAREFGSSDGGSSTLDQRRTVFSSELDAKSPATAPYSRTRPAMATTTVCTEGR